MPLTGGKVSREVEDEVECPYIVRYDDICWDWHETLGGSRYLWIMIIECNAWLDADCSNAYKELPT